MSAEGPRAFVRLGPRLAILAWVVLAAGCGPDLDRYRIVTGDGGGASRDGGSTPDASQRDGASGADGGTDAGHAGPCEPPLVAVAVENLGTGGGAGTVLRAALRGTSPWETCPALTGRGTLDAQPFALTVIDASTVMIATRDNLIALDGDRDEQLWRVSLEGMRAMDANPIRDPGRGDTLAAIALGTPGIDEIRSVVTYPRGGTRRQRWTLNTGDLPLGLGVRSMAQSPRDPTKLVFLKPGDYAALEVDPYARTREEMPWVAERAELSLRRLFGVGTGREYRLAWTGSRGGEEGVYYMNQSGAAAPAIAGPVRCRDRACTFVQIAPDPSRPTGFVAICEEEARRELVRFSSVNGSCETIASEVDLPYRARFSALSVLGEDAP